MNDVDLVRFYKILHSVTLDATRLEDFQLANEAQDFMDTVWFRMTPEQRIQARKEVEA